MQTQVKVHHEWTNSVSKAEAWLDSLPDLIALDFEAALIYTHEDIQAFKSELEDCTDPARKIEINAALKASALSHPAYVTPTHLSVAWSESDAYVIVIDSEEMLNMVMHYLTTTTRKQIWHNISYDARLIYYYSDGGFPPDYEDTALLAKCLLNHVEVNKAGVRLKDLMGYKYGSWAVSADNFDLSMQYDEDLIKYAAIDACATFALWDEIQASLERE